MQTIPTLLMLAVILGGPILIAWLLARLLRLPEFAWKIWLVLFSIVLAVLPLAARYPNSLQLGVDLSGGTILVYEVDRDQLPPEGFEMANMIAAISQRINPSGTVDVTVRPSGENRVEIIIPRATDEEVRRYKDIITNLGSLEFRILANARDHASLIRRGELSFPRPVTQPIRFDLDASFEQELATKAQATQPSERELSDELHEIFSENALDLADSAKVLAKDEDDGSTWKIASGGRTIPVKKEGDRLVVEGERIEAEWIPVAKSQQDDFGGEGQVAVRNDPEMGLMVLLVRERPRDEVTGQFLRRAETGIAQSGRPNVNFRFNSEGARRFGRLTGRNTPERDGFRRRLAVVLSGEIHSAPGIESQIRDQGEISGDDFTKAQVEGLVQVLNAGSLPAALNTVPVTEQTIGPTLGRDTIEKGTRAILVSLIAVLVFIGVYYLYFAGTVADFCLVLNLLLVVGMMSLTEATFTLPGLAGLVLTVGMSIDANVLIFERIREERDRGGALRVAIRNGFTRAYRTIVDANITTLLTAAILFGIGTDQVKGFAVTLFIGIVMSMYTAMFVSRLIFEIFERKGWISDVPMLRIVGNTRWDFLSKRTPCLIASSVLIAIGLIAIGARGSNLLDIDFTGGTLVSVRFTEPQETETVREQAESVLPDVTVEDLTLGTERTESGKYDRFLIRTTAQDPEAVKEQIIEAFGSRLVRLGMDYGSVEAIPGEDTTQDDGEEETESDSESETSEVAPSHRFAGGSRVELTFSEPVAIAAVEGYFEEYFEESEGVTNAALQFEVAGVPESTVGENQFGKMTLESSFPPPSIEAALSSVKDQLAGEPLFDRINNFGGQVAGETQQLALFAMLASLLVIVCYIWIRFQAVTFGLAAVAALVHDVLIVLGLVALSGLLVEGPAGFLGQMLLLDSLKINLPMIAAFLTLVGYSLNDTIVVFDRIREVRGKSPEITKEMINTSVNQSLSRTLLTSLTTLLAVGILYVWGGEGIHGFAFCLVAGVFVGTYSSVYIASPVLLWLSNRKKTPSAGRRSRPSASKSLSVAKSV